MPLQHLIGVSASSLGSCLLWSITPSVHHTAIEKGT